MASDTSFEDVRDDGPARPHAADSAAHLCGDVYENLSQELTPLLNAKDVNVSSVREICQRYLNIPLATKKSNATRGKKHRSNIPSLPPDLRPWVWKVLLGCHTKDESMFDKWDHKLDLDNQKVIRGDCDRTRPGLVVFDDQEGRLRNELELMLTFYCKSRGVSYKQGLNEILAPFLVCFVGYPRGTIFNCFYSLISKFLPSIFNDREFESLQCIMRLFNLLLLYHDPSLCNFLNQYHILPELYATPWFITLFARKMPLDLLYSLWDVYIVEDDPFLHYFVALALLVFNRKLLLETDQHNLPATLASLSLDSLGSIKKMIAQAKLYRSRTPISLRQKLYEISFTNQSSNGIRMIRRQLEALPCLDIPALELVQQCYHEILEDGVIKYIVLDCRPLSHFENGRLPCAIHLSPELLDDPEEMVTVLNGFQAMKGCHFCLLGPGTVPVSDYPPAKGSVVRSVETKVNEKDELEEKQTAYQDDPSSLFLLCLLQKGFDHVSRCSGGYAACHRLIEGAETELVDHNAAMCEVCAPGCHRSKKPGASRRFVSPAGSTVSALASVGSGLLNKLRGLNLKLRARPAEEVLPREPERTSSEQLETAASLSSSASPPPEMCGPIAIAKLRAMSDVKLFTCQRVLRHGTENAGVVPRLLAITPHYVMSFYPASTTPSGAAGDGGLATLKSRHKIAFLDKITSSKKIRNLLTFHWSLPGRAERKLEHYLVDQSRECIQIVKERFLANTPGKEDPDVNVK